LTEYAIQTTLDTAIVQAQLDNPDMDVISNLPFPTGEETDPTDQEKVQAVRDYLANCSVQEKAALYTKALSQPSQEYVDQMVSAQTASLTRKDIEQMIAQQYAGQMGVDADTLTAYMEGMTDEELFARVEEAIAQQVTAQYAQQVAARLAALPAEQLGAMMDAALTDQGNAQMQVSPLTQAQYDLLFQEDLPPTLSQRTYDQVLDLLGYVDLDTPDTISLYATTFSDKDKVAQLITQYNEGVSDPDDQITYTDYVALLMSSITDIISGISYLLIAFVSISLVVSSIMIGIITYISVLERTKEIGILRAVGASKRDISRVFNAETLIVGLTAGLIGIGVTLLLLLPINAVLLAVTGLTGLKAALPVVGGVVLVSISALLTIVAGLIPARIAARKDPVEALRSE
ncbi:MAG TPA: ABC transporter, partial [Clostridiales bacterium]|nr:ABC transporter [Clostridiales bacterium]